jgi:hypothetical protein
MATTFTLRHDINCSVDRFWEMFFDPELQKNIFKELGFPKWEVVEAKDTEKEVVRTISAIPKIDAPAPVAKLMGPGFGYTEEGRFDRASKVYKFVITPSTMADKMTNTGSVRVEPKGDDKCTRIVEIFGEARIFGLGGTIEKMTEKNIREGWDYSARKMNEILAKK